MDEVAVHSEGSADRRVRRAAVVAVLCASILIVNVDTTILNVALPRIVTVLRATTSELQWVVDAYAMTLAGLLLVGGSMADRFGRKRFFLVGLAVFGTGSIGSAFSGSVDLLIACRAVMGLGASAMMPSSLSIINDIFRDPGARAKAIGAWAGTSGLGIAIGPIGGGLLLAHFWWGSVFLVNVPIVLVGLVAAAVIVPESRNEAARRADPLGAALSIGGFGLLLWSIIEAPTLGWTARAVLLAGASSVVLLSAFVLFELRTTHPMLELAYFKDRRFSVATAAEGFGLFGLLGALFIQTQFLQFDLGYTPLGAGVRILPIAGVLGVTATASPLVSRAIGTRLTATGGLLAAAGGLWQIAAAASVTATYPDVLPGMMLIGLGAGLLIPSATNSVVGSVSQGDAGVGSATNGVALQVGGALGVAIIGSIESTRYQARLTAMLSGHPVPAAAMHQILGSLGGALGVAAAAGADGRLLAVGARTAFMSGLGLSLATGALVAAVGALLVVGAFPSRRTSRALEGSTGGDDRLASGDRTRPHQAAEVTGGLVAGTASERKAASDGPAPPDGAASSDRTGGAGGESLADRGEIVR